VLFFEKVLNYIDSSLHVVDYTDKTNAVYLRTIPYEVFGDQVAVVVH
jgi:hypothetical protein